MKVAVLVDEFPLISETFILNHIVGLKNIGYTVHVFPTHKAKQGAFHQLFYKHNLQKNTYYPPIYPSSRVDKILGCIKLGTRSFKSFRLLLKCLITKFHINYLTRLSLFFRAIPFIDKGNYDIVHCHYAPNGNVAIQLQNLNLCKGAIITHLHGYDIHNKQFIKTISYKYLFNEGKAFIVNSDFTALGYQRLGGDASKAVYIPEALDTTLFKPLPNKPHTINEKNFFFIISVGRLVDFKGFHYGILTIKDLIQKGYTNIRYTVIGAGPLHEELKELVKKEQLTEFISLVGLKNQTEILEALQISDVFLSPGIIAESGRQENQGLVIQEAQAVEVPVVVTDVGGTKQGLIDGVTGFLVPPEDIGELSSKIELLLRDPSLRANMGKAGRMFVKEKFDVTVNDKKIIHLYNKVAKGI
ncbi:glycosyltransferase [Pontibacter silvestris]|uniref:Glycosyltransferase n=1 Tax=Pontibacter silvestris TaxID=2305183 RepID=A0ABW4WVT7_9BACT|nr:glycosyltransferase [Pontibacter silvestris]MCC9137339.1 glycosyltransferase [Pontibacter silvestris]